LHCCHRRTEPRPQVIRTENFVQFEHVVFQIAYATGQTDRPTDTQTDTQTR